MKINRASHKNCQQMLINTQGEKSTIVDKLSNPGVKEEL